MFSPLSPLLPFTSSAVSVAVPPLQPLQPLPPFFSSSSPSVVSDEKIPPFESQTSDSIFQSNPLLQNLNFYAGLYDCKLYKDLLEMAQKENNYQALESITLQQSLLELEKFTSNYLLGATIFRNIYNPVQTDKSYEPNLDLLTYVCSDVIDALSCFSDEEIRAVHNNTRKPYIEILLNKRKFDILLQVLSKGNPFLLEFITNKTGYSFESSLAEACYGGNIAIVDYLVCKHLNNNQEITEALKLTKENRSFDGGDYKNVIYSLCNAFSKACVSGNFELVVYMYKKYSSIIFRFHTIPFEDRITNIDCIKFVLSFMRSLDEVEYQCILFSCLTIDNVSLFKFLISKYPEIARQNFFHYFDISDMGAINVAKYLLEESKMDIEYFDTVAPFDRKSPLLIDKNALMSACVEEKFELCNFYLQHWGGNIEVDDMSVFDDNPTISLKSYQYLYRNNIYRNLVKIFEYEISGGNTKILKWCKNTSDERKDEVPFFRQFVLEEPQLEKLSSELLEWLIAENVFTRKELDEYMEETIQEITKGYSNPSFDYILVNRPDIVKRVFPDRNEIVIELGDRKSLSLKAVTALQYQYRFKLELSDARKGYSLFDLERDYFNYMVENFMSIDDLLMTLKESRTISHDHMLRRSKNRVEFTPRSRDRLEKLDEIMKRIVGSYNIVLEKLFRRKQQEEEEVEEKKDVEMEEDVDGEEEVVDEPMVPLTKSNRWDFNRWIVDEYIKKYFFCYALL